MHFILMLKYFKHTENNITTTHTFKMCKHFASKFILKRKKYSKQLKHPTLYHSPSPFPVVSEQPEIEVLLLFLTFTCLFHLYS